MRIEPLSIYKTQPVRNLNFKSYLKIQSLDEFVCEKRQIDKTPLVKRNIISQNQDVDSFFKSFVDNFNLDAASKKELFELLKFGFVSFSSNFYSDICNPKSAVAVELDETKPSYLHCVDLDKYLNDGAGIGINFSKFENPIEEIKNINSYFKTRESALLRPPAGIALLNVNHPKIIDFISLKDDANYKNWCFDLSVVMDDDFFDKLDKNEEIPLSNGGKILAQDIYSKLLDSIAKSGEPGIIFSNEKDFICDCCATCKLLANEELKLAHINLSKFYDFKTQILDKEKLLKSAKILSSALKNISPDSYIGVLGYQDLLNKMNLKYGSKEAIDILDKSLSLIKSEAKKNNIKMAISPTGTVSRILKTSPSIEPNKNQNLSYKDEIDTMITAQKYLEGGISKTIILRKDFTLQDIDFIIRYCKKNNIKGISLFPTR